ncbi:DegT/DnrJ/EryC1/StrS family aminotransferase [bacterium]|nr:DegT/DnrJ/EryC1/StrS family aminotransferase [candidate division CSSED10-310 bacterium]
MGVPLLDIKRQIYTIRKEIDDVLRNVIDQTQFILGPEVKIFEQNIAKYCHTDHAVGVASGTDALIIALQAVGVAKGDEVITTPYSFFATASAIWRLGAKPVFVDIDPHTYNIDTSSVYEMISNKTKAVLVVHLFGQSADMDALSSLPEHIPVIEDAAQALSAKWNGIHAGNLGVCGCFSFFPSKNLGGFGDGGMITTSNSELAQKCKALRVHGALQTYIHEEVGYNSRLDTIQAAVLNVKLNYLDKWSEKRRQNAHFYNTMFQNTPVVTPKVHSKATPIYNQYVIRTPQRDLLRKKLTEMNIGNAVYYPLPLHLQPCFRELHYREGAFPEAEAASKETIALPIFAELNQDELNIVAEAVLEHIKAVS